MDRCLPRLVYGIAYGFQLGLGVVTIVTSAATWVTLAAAALAAVAWLVAGVAVVGRLRRSAALPILFARRSAPPPRCVTSSAGTNASLRSPVAHYGRTGPRVCLALLDLLVAT